MTDKERIDRARRAQLALDEFLNDAFNVVTGDYMARLDTIISREPWATDKVKCLITAKRIAEEVRNQITALVLDGQEAQAKINRAKRVENMTASDKRLLGIGPF